MKVHPEILQQAAKDGGVAFKFVIRWTDFGLRLEEKLLEAEIDADFAEMKENFMCYLTLGEEEYDRQIGASYRDSRLPDNLHTEITTDET